MTRRLRPESPFDFVGACSRMRKRPGREHDGVAI
jgi:hypothetical protein